MNTATAQQWQQEFGITVHAGDFFSTEADLNRVTPHSPFPAHVARRAFELLKLDGVLCTPSAPLVYFKQVARIDNAEIAKLHRAFWNHGGAPILAIIAPREVHVYSGFVRPASDADRARRIPAFVQMLERASSELKAFLPAVQSGAFLQRHPLSFDVSHRVDRDLLDSLQATRDKLLALPAANIDPDALDALLCRLVFACYLFDRDVIGEHYKEQLGLPHAAHLRDVLGLQPTAKAKEQLYRLFERLGTDFNGDLFSDDLGAEASLVSASHIKCLYDFFRGTDAVTGQRSIWPYDFSVIPVETISAIYERFLAPEHRRGAFYTPRFLAELVLDIALSKTPTLLKSRYLDPACGSGIFLVGLFNRMAEEWKRANPDAGNDRRARELRIILCENLSGIDVNATACRITAFSLYLAYLDQLSPRDIELLRLTGHRLPKLLNRVGQSRLSGVEGNIWCGDFFSDTGAYPRDVDVVVGNPPWGSIGDTDSRAKNWCSRSDVTLTVPDKQISAAFVWKASSHVGNSGRVCFVLPHSTLFNRKKSALQFQRTLFTQHSVDHVMNLADYQRFLFGAASHPAIVVSYRKAAPIDKNHKIEYLTPKVDWFATRSEVIAVAPVDQHTVTLEEVLQDLWSPDAPQIWKQRFWATPRDRRMIDRLSLYPRLRDHVRQVREVAPAKPWMVAVGVQDLGPRDDPAAAETIALPSRLFIDAKSSDIDLFLLPSDCEELAVAEYTVRRGSNKTITPFRAPHVLVKEGFGGAAYADFDVSFLFSLRGFSGRPEDRDELIFLAAYLGTALARFFLFHTSSSWGMSRQRVGVDELLRLPFPLPDALTEPQQARRVIKDVKEIYTKTIALASDPFVDRRVLVKESRNSIEKLVDEYFDILPFERTLIDDTVRVIIPSTRPTRSRDGVPTVKPSTPAQRDGYTNRLCTTLNAWAGEGVVFVDGGTIASDSIGIGVAVIEKSVRGREPRARTREVEDLLATLKRIRDIVSRQLNTFELIRGIKVFEQERLYIVKQIAQRFWTETAALNDADEIAGLILMQHSRATA